MMGAESERWRQPAGVYYHYERSRPGDSLHQAYSGLYMNGICMYSDSPNEYLQVELNEPLRKGERYAFSCKARLMAEKAAGAASHRLIGVHLGDRAIDVSEPRNLYLDAHMRLELPDAPERLQWFALRDTFVAAGGERYMSIGYFEGMDRLERKLLAQEAFMESIEEGHRMQEHESSEDKAWLYLPPDEQRKYLKEQKKKQAKQKKRQRRSKGRNDTKAPNASRRNAKVADCPEVYDSQGSQKGREKSREIPMPLGQFSGPLSEGSFAVRYYFDDFCLAPIREGEAICESAKEEQAYPDMTELKSGSSFRLDKVFFEHDSEALIEKSNLQLEALRRVLAEQVDLQIEIQGHTDSEGSAAYNDDLSLRRAEAVRQWLIGNGIDSGRLSAKGFGERQPIASNSTAMGRQQNRRVEIVVK